MTRQFEIFLFKTQLTQNHIAMFKGQCQEIFKVAHKCQGNLSEPCENFHQVFNIHLCGISCSSRYKFSQSVNRYMEILSKSCSFLPFGEIVKMHFIIGIVLTTPLRSCICRHRSSQIIKEGKCKVNLIKKKNVILPHQLK